jgi:hypothetical protein
MRRNVGPVERWARLAAGLGAGMAALSTRGWPRTALGTLAVMWFGTGLTRYCPISEAIGRYPEGESPLEQGLRDTELRRQTAMASALGSKPSTHAPQPRVTAESDVFGR